MGLGDAAEIFIFISGYTAAFVYGRVMLKSGFAVASARILKRVWQIYAAHVLLLAILVAEVSYVTISLEKPFYAKEMEIVDFLGHPGESLMQALLLRYRPLNMDVLPLYIVLMFFLPLILLMIKWRANLTLAISVALYTLSWQYDLHLTAFPDGFLGRSIPLLWQLLFVFGAWCALGGVRRMSRILSSPITLWAAFAYLFAAFGVTMTWYFPQLNHLPHLLEQWIYPIDKTDFDVLRFAHFLALAVLAVRFVPAGWPGLKSPWLRPMILCGQYSLQIFCLGVALAFAGYFLLMEISAGIGLHFLVGISGDPDHVRRGMAVHMVQAGRRQKWQSAARLAFNLKRSTRSASETPAGNWAAGSGHATFSVFSVSVQLRSPHPWSWAGSVPDGP